MFLKGTQRIRPVDYLEPGKKYWGKFTRTCAVFVDGDSALVPHQREELLTILADCDNVGKQVSGVDLLIGTVYVENDKGEVLKYPMNKYRKVYINDNRITLKSPSKYCYVKEEEQRYSTAKARSRNKEAQRLWNALSNGGFNVLAS